MSIQGAVIGGDVGMFLGGPVGIAVGFVVGVTIAKCISKLVFRTKKLHSNESKWSCTWSLTTLIIIEQKEKKNLNSNYKGDDWMREIVEK